MKAITFRAYGSPEVLRLEEIEKPSAGDEEVLVRVCAASVNPLDWRFMRGEPYVIRGMTGWSRPSEPGMGVDLAGVVEAVGSKVTKVRPGDEVFGVCPKRGAFAEHVCTLERNVAAKPTHVTFEQAAAVPVAAFTALQGLRDQGRIRSGQRVLVNGAAGGVGTFAIQIAKSYGAEVTGVCSTRNVELVRSIGADHVVDYTREDFAAGDRRYDLILDAIANRSLSDCRRVMTRKGIYVVVGAPGGRWFAPLFSVLKPMLVSPFVSQELVSCLSMESQEDLQVLKGLLETGKVKPVIDRRYALAEVPEAIGYLEKGHARGKVVIAIA